MGMTLICKKCGTVYDAVRKESASGAGLLYLYLDADPKDKFRFIAAVVGERHPICHPQCRGELVAGGTDDRAQVD